MDTLTKEQRASIFAGMYECETKNGYSVSAHDAVRIIGEIIELVKQLELDLCYVNESTLLWAIEIITKHPELIIMQPDNVRYIYEKLNQKVPKWFVEKWEHTFKKNQGTENISTGKAPCKILAIR